jgi:polyprenyldihydroxybenzoate methyltransferase/3-demethylubiquinol 3-O-methyltransferase
MATAIRPLARSINPQEIAFFSKLSAQWWNENGEFGLLHRMNPVRTQFITQKLDVKGLDVLDVGCGGGLLSESLARLGAKTLGVDASESNIRIAEHHAASDSALSSLTYRHTAAEDLLALPKRYDAVCSMEVIEHVDDPASFLQTLTQLVKPGGHLFLSTIARTPLAYFLTIFAAEKLLRKVEPGTHTYEKFISPSELVQFFQNLKDPEAGGAPWIPKHPVSHHYDLRGIIYLPWENRWTLLNRSTSQWGGTECNYIFWVRKPPAVSGPHVP